MSNGKGTKDGQGRPEDPEVPSGDDLERALRRQYEALGREHTPERLLELARQLKRLIKRRGGRD